MATVLQRVKDKRLTAAQEAECRIVFDLATEGAETMTSKQLKTCLRALGCTVAKGEAQTLVYEFDYSDTQTIDLADFQKIFLSKMLEKSEHDQFNQAFRSISSDAGNVSIQELSSALHATELFSDSDAAEDAEQIDGDLLRYHMSVQYYADDDIEAIQEYVENTNTKVVSKAALAAFLRV